jgi:hypothetical protein
MTADDLPDSDSQAVNNFAVSLRTDMKKRAEVISRVVTTVLEIEGYWPAVAQARKFFATNSADQMEKMKAHFTSLALEFLIVAGFYKN